MDSNSLDTHDAVISSELLSESNPEPLTFNILLVENPSRTREAGSGDSRELRGLRLPAAPTALRSDAGSSLILECVRTPHGEIVVMTTSPGTDVRRNGLAPPLVAPLALGDEIVLGDGTSLHVSRIQRATATAPPPELLGVRCDVCLVAFTAKTKVLACASCGRARHLEGDEIPRDDRLECAVLGPCPNCQTEAPQSDGFAYWPEA